MGSIGAPARAGRAARRGFVYRALSLRRLFATPSQELFKATAEAEGSPATPAWPRRPLGSSSSPPPKGGGVSRKGRKTGPEVRLRAGRAPTALAALEGSGGMPLGRRSWAGKTWRHGRGRGRERATGGWQSPDARQGYRLTSFKSGATMRVGSVRAWTSAGV